MGRDGAWLELPLIWAPSCHSPGIGGVSCGYLRPPGAKGKDPRTWDGCGGRTAGWGPGRAGVPPQPPEATCWLALWGTRVRGVGRKAGPAAVWLRRLSSRWMGEVITAKTGSLRTCVWPGRQGRGPLAGSCFQNTKGEGLGSLAVVQQRVACLNSPCWDVRPGGVHTGPCPAAALPGRRETCLNTLSSSGQALSCNGGHAVGAPTQDALGCPSPGHGPCNASAACTRNLPSRERQTLEGQPASAPGRRPPTHPAPTLRRALGTQASRVCTWRVGP